MMVPPVESERAMVPTRGSAVPGTQEAFNKSQTKYVSEIMKLYRYI